ncbi:hypothetical protein LINPERPRIM_LOCUS7805 [Linum perenne]
MKAKEEEEVKDMDEVGDEGWELAIGFVLKAVFHPGVDGGVTVPWGDYAEAFVPKFVISFILMFCRYCRLHRHQSCRRANRNRSRGYSNA